MGKYFLLWVVTIILATVLTPFMVGTGVMSSRIGVDYRDTLAVFGGKSHIDQALVAIYQDNLAMIGYAANEFRDRHDDSDYYRNSGDPIGEAIGVIPADIAAAVKLQAYSAALRWLILKEWTVWMALPCVLAVLVGLMTRRLKRDTFEPPRPPVYNTSAHLLLGSMFLTVLWLACPLVPISVVAIPLLSTLICITLSMAIANYPDY